MGRWWYLREGLGRELCSRLASHPNLKKHLTTNPGTKKPTPLSPNPPPPNLPTRSNQEDEINFQLLPLPDSSLSSADLSLPKLGKPYLRTSGRLKVLQIKKYLNKKIGEVVPNVHVQLFCQNTLLGNELSLTFLKKTRWRNNETDLILHYRKSKNEEKE